MSSIRTKGNSHLLTTGDFNLTGINWTTWSTQNRNEEDEDAKFLEILRDGFLFQHILEPTRARSGNEPSILDLIIKMRKK